MAEYNIKWKDTIIQMAFNQYCACSLRCNSMDLKTWIEENIEYIIEIEIDKSGRGNRHILILRQMIDTIFSFLYNYGFTNDTAQSEYNMNKIIKENPGKYDEKNILTNWNNVKSIIESIKWNVIFYNAMLEIGTKK